MTRKDARADINMRLRANISARQSNTGAGQEAALQAMVERAEEIERLDREKSGRLCSLFDDARLLAHEGYLRLLGMPPEAQNLDLAMGHAVHVARGAVSRWLGGQEVGRASVGSDTTEMYRGYADLDTPALRAMVRRGSTIVDEVTDNTICELYVHAYAASRSRAVANKAQWVDAASPDVPTANPRESLEAALRAIDAWLDERT